MLVTTNLAVANLMSVIRLTAPERRAAIIAAAINLFAEKGFRGVTTRELAQAVGVSEPVLYDHFPSKRDLYNALMDSMAASSRELFGNRYMPKDDGTRSDRDFFIGVASTIIEWHERNPAYVRLFLFSALEGHELGERFFHRHSSTFLDELAGCIRSRIESGRFRPVDPTLAAYHFMGIVGHHGVNCAMAEKGKPTTPRTEVIESIVDLFLKGVQA